MYATTYNHTIIDVNDRIKVVFKCRDGYIMFMHWWINDVAWYTVRIVGNMLPISIIERCVDHRIILCITRTNANIVAIRIVVRFNRMKMWSLPFDTIISWICLDCYLAMAIVVIFACCVLNVLCIVNCKYQFWYWSKIPRDYDVSNEVVVHVTCWRWREVEISTLRDFEAQ